MDRPLRLVTGLAMAQVLVAAALLAVRNTHLSLTPLVVSDGELTSVPRLALIITTVFLVLAWTYLLAGASQAHPAVTALGFAGFLAAQAPIESSVGLHGAPGTVRVAAVVLVGVLLVADHWRGLPGPARFAGLAVAVGAIYATYAWDAHDFTISRFFTFGVALQLMVLSFGLLPMLFLAGAEFAEWTELVTSRAAEVTSRWRAPLLPALLVAGVSVAVLVDVIDTYGRQLWSQVALGLIAAALIAWRARRARAGAGWPSHIPWAALALAAVCFIGILLIEVAHATHIPKEPARKGKLAVGGTLHVFRHATDPQFSLRVPETWEVERLDNGSRGGDHAIVAFSGISTANGAVLTVTAEPESLLPAGDTLLRQFAAHFYKDRAFRPARPTTQRGWRAVAFRLGSGLDGLSWERRIGRRRWLVFAFASTKLFALDRPLFQAMFASFRAALPAPAAEKAKPRREASPYAYDPVVTVPFLAWLAITIAAGAALPAASRRWGRGPTAGVLFFFVAGLLFVLSQLRQVGEQLAGGSLGDVYSLRVPGVQAAAAVASLAALGWLAARRRLSARHLPLLSGLLVLDAGLQLLVWLNELYNSAAGVGARLSIAQGIVVLVALLWELTSSGESITNGDSRAFPRPTRVLLFCAYVMLTATAVLFFSTLRIQATGAAVLPQFESELWPALGIVQLGVPALVCVLLLRVVRR